MEIIRYLIDGEIIPAATYFGSLDYILDNPYAYGIAESEDGAGEYYMGILPNHISST